MRKDLVMEICLAGVGVFMGSILPALSGLSHFNSKPQTAGWIDLLSIVLCGAAFTATLITAFQWYVRQKGHVSLVSEIQNRPKVPVHLIDVA